MSDELDARVRALEAERLRPVPPRPSAPRRLTPDEIEALCVAVAPDYPRRVRAEERREDYLWLRGIRVPMQEAAQRIGISVETAKKYEQQSV